MIRSVARSITHGRRGARRTIDANDDEKLRGVQLGNDVDDTPPWAPPYAAEVLIDHPLATRAREARLR